jgi:TRAP-type C4-dicarboxylate transport system substrate-binding protein
MEVAYARLSMRWIRVGRQFVRSRAFCLLLAAFCLVATPSALAQTTTLRLSLPISTESSVGQNIQDFGRAVETRTRGAIRIEFQGKDRNFEENEVVSAVSSGAIEIGATPINQFAYDVPLAGAFLQPFLFNFDALVEAATKRDGEIRKLIEDEILFWTNARVLWWQPYGSGVIFSRKTPVTNPAAIVDRAVGAPDDQTKELIRICGGNPHLVSPSDLFDELQKGTIQAAATDIMNVKERALWQAVDTITNLRNAPSLYVVVINEKTWQSIAPENRAILSEVAHEAQIRMWESFAAIRAEAYAFATQKGMSVVELPADDVAAWRACSASLLETYMDRIGNAGRKLFAAYGKLRTDACCRNAPGDTPFSNR